MNEDHDVTPAPRTGTRKIVTAVGVGAVGLVAGGVLAGTLSAASAETGTNGSSSTSGYGGYGVPGDAGRGGDQTRPQRSDEKLLTGTTKTKVLAAVAKKYPSATVERAETDSDGVYEVHVLLNGTPTIVQVGRDFTVTGTQTMQGGGHGGHGGDHDGDGPSTEGA